MNEKTERSILLQFWDSKEKDHRVRVWNSFTPASITTGEKTLNALQQKLAGREDRGAFCSHLSL